MLFICAESKAWGQWTNIENKDQSKALPFRARMDINEVNSLTTAGQAICIGLLKSNNFCLPSFCGLVWG